MLEHVSETVVVTTLLYELFTALCSLDSLTSDGFGSQSNHLPTTSREKKICQGLPGRLSCDPTKIIRENKASASLKKENGDLS